MRSQHRSTTIDKAVVNVAIPHIVDNIGFGDDLLQINGLKIDQLYSPLRIHHGSGCMHTVNLQTFNRC